MSAVKGGWVWLTENTDRRVVSRMVNGIKHWFSDIALDGSWSWSPDRNNALVFSYGRLVQMSKINPALGKIGVADGVNWECVA